MRAYIVHSILDLQCSYQAAAACFTNLKRCQNYYKKEREKTHTQNMCT